MTDEPLSEPSRTADAHDVIASETYRRSRGLWRVLAFVALAIAILALVGRFAWPDKAAADHIARLVVDGTITTDPSRLKAIDDLVKDNSVKAVIVAINSPGGTTAGGEELYEALSRLREASRWSPSSTNWALRPPI